MTTSCNVVLAHLGIYYSDLHRVPCKQQETKLEATLGGRLYLLMCNECLLFKRGGGFTENEVGEA